MFVVARASALRISASLALTSKRPNLAFLACCGAGLIVPSRQFIRPTANSSIVQIKDLGPVTQADLVGILGNLKHLSAIHNYLGQQCQKNVLRQMKIF